MVKENSKKLNRNILIIVVILFFVSVSYNNPSSSQSIGGLSGCSSSGSGSNPSTSEQAILNVYLTDQFCTAQYDPVCANGISYPNSCFAELAGKTNYIPGKCVINRPNFGAHPITIKSSIIKIELFGPDEWITLYEGSIPIELEDENTQQILAEKIREGIYSKIRITWGSTIVLEYDDGTSKTIEFKEKTWLFNLPNINAVSGKTRNVLIDIPLKDSLEFSNERIFFKKVYRIEHNLEDRFELRRENIGLHISTYNLERNDIFNKIEELKNRLKTS